MSDVSPPPPPDDHDEREQGHGHHHHHHHHHDGERDPIERVVDVAVVGGSTAAYDAAVMLGRERRGVIVLDVGDTADDLRSEARSHGVEVLAREVIGVEAADDGRFRIGLAGGDVVVARRVVQATDADVAATAAEIGRLTAGRPGEEEWDARFAGDPVFSGNPNGTLVAEVADLRPGRALDVGAGEGGDAVWLAEQGWAVTATDVSGQALARIRAVAADRGVDVELVHADAGAADPFGAETFDLVSAQYPVIPRTADGRAVANLLDAVAPGGTLIFVHHDPAAFGSDRPWDGAAFVQPADVAAAVRDSPDFDVEADDQRPRPAGHATVDVDDVIVRARRRD